MRQATKKSLPSQLGLFIANNRHKTQRLRRTDCACVTCNQILTTDFQRDVEKAYTEAEVILDGCRRLIYWCRPCAECIKTFIPDDGTVMKTNFQGYIVPATSSEAKRIRKPKIKITTMGKIDQEAFYTNTIFSANPESTLQGVA